MKHRLIIGSAEENPPDKIRPKYTSSSEQAFLNNFCWVFKLRHREEGKSSRELFEKVRVNAVFFWCFWILGGLLGVLKRRVTERNFAIAVANFYRRPEIAPISGTLRKVNIAPISGTLLTQEKIFQVKSNKFLELPRNFVFMTISGSHSCCIDYGTFFVKVPMAMS